MHNEGLSNLYQKIIDESSEMVFLADDVHPYPIIYANAAFERNIGSTLRDRSLIGLRLDVNADVVRRELTLSHEEKSYRFNLEPVEEQESNRFLFHRGKESESGDIPTTIKSDADFDFKHILWGIGKDSYLTNVSPGVTRILGFDPWELVQTDLSNLIHGDDLKRVLLVWESLLQTRDSALFELRFRGRDGNYRQLECSVEFDLENFYVTARDISMSVESSRFNMMELELTDYRENGDNVKPTDKASAEGDLLSNLSENVPGGLFQLRIDAEGQLSFQFLSKGFKSVTGLSPTDFLRFSTISDLMTMVHPEDLPQVVASSAEASRKLEIWQCQFRLRSGSGDQPYRWVLSAARPQTLENGAIMWYGYISDITIHKEFEAKLDEARLSAEKAHRVKSDFLSMISHELRTPLNAISGSVYSLFLEDPTETQKSALNTINFAVDNLLIMINDLLDFQKVEAGKLTIEKQPLNLKDLMVQVIKGLSFHANDSKNKLELHLSEGLDISVMGDKTRLSQVMNNLITNALKFTKQGRVDVRVESLSQTTDKVRVNFSVADTGIGIAPEHKQQIFNDFDQVKPTFSSKYGGTGLGLSITKKLLALMGGTILVESELGKGSRFYFDLVFEKVQEAPADVVRIESPHASIERRHLLMAEDNEVNSLVLGKIVRKWGYTYHRVPNGKEAVEAAKVGKYDCILMDIQMPVMDGLEAAREIKKFSGTPIIALTAAAQDFVDKIDDFAFDEFVSKPIDASELLEKVRIAVNGKA